METTVLVYDILNKYDKGTKTFLQKTVYFTTFHESFEPTIYGMHSPIVQRIGFAFDRYPKIYKKKAKYIYIYYVDIEEFIEGLISFVPHGEDIVLLSKIVHLVRSWENKNGRLLKQIDEDFINRAILLGWEKDLERINEELLLQYINFYYSIPEFERMVEL